MPLRPDGFSQTSDLRFAGFDMPPASHSILRHSRLPRLFSDHTEAEPLDPVAQQVDEIELTLFAGWRSPFPNPRQIL